MWSGPGQVAPLSPFCHVSSLSAWTQVSNLLLKSVTLQLRLFTGHHLMGLKPRYEHLFTKAGPVECNPLVHLKCPLFFPFAGAGGSGRSLNTLDKFFTTDCFPSPALPKVHVLSSKSTSVFRVPSLLLAGVTAGTVHDMSCTVPLSAGVWSLRACGVKTNTLCCGIQLDVTMNQIHMGSLGMGCALLTWCRL